MKLLGITTGLVLLFTVGIAQATLVTIGSATYSGSDYNLIWDDDNNGNSVVWLDYTHDKTDWSAQNAWAAGLGGTGVLTYNIDSIYMVDWGTGNDWRLGSTVDGVHVEGYEGDPNNDGIYTYNAGYNLTNSEMGHLYYEELGNLGWLDTNGNTPAGYGLQNIGDFVNLVESNYWSGTEYANVNGNAWAFDMDDGDQKVLNGSNAENHYSYGLAVRTGQITVAPVPEPSTILLLGSGLAGLAFYRRKRK